MGAERRWRLTLPVGVEKKGGRRMRRSKSLREERPFERCPEELAQICGGEGWVVGAVLAEGTTGTQNDEKGECV